MNEDLWYYIGTFLDTKELCNVTWANIEEGTWYLKDLNRMVKSVTFYAIGKLLGTIKRPPRCIMYGCTRTLNFQNIAEFYCFEHNQHEIIELYSTPWYFFDVY